LSTIFVSVAQVKVDELRMRQEIRDKKHNCQ